MIDKNAYVSHDFSEEGIRKKRKFPIANTVLIAFLILLQIGLVFFAIFYDPKPQDKIEEYSITVEPREDGTLDIRYDITWTPLDEDEPLTWIRVGIANPNVTYYPSLLSDTIQAVTLDEDDDYVAAIVDLKQAYRAGEAFTFSFTLRQGSLLCKDADGWLYSFVPGWFNATPVEHYTFRWKNSDAIRTTNAARRDGEWLVWEGSMPCGSYVSMDVRYDEQAFDGASWVNHVPFDDSGVYDQLKDDKAAIIALAVVGIILLLVFEILLLDSHVSYSRGRGFLHGHGHYIHVYGYSNPLYIRARDEYNRTHASSGGGRSGGGCACACACACAGGGRAGCSQKDTAEIKRQEKA